MATARVFSEPSGHVHVLYLNEKLRLPGETDSDFMNRLGPTVASKSSGLAGLSFVDVDQAVIQALPRSQRHKWRVNPGGHLRVDPTIPDPPHPKQAKLNKIAAATSIDELKVLLTEIVKGE